MKLAIPSLGLLALMSFAASAANPNQAAITSQQDPTKAYITITVSTPSQSNSSELAGGSVVTITKKIMPAASVHFDGGGDLNVGDTLPPGSVLPDGGTLPTTGTPGQTFTVDSCVPRHSNDTYTVKWVPTPDPGHWEVVKVQNTQAASIQCNT
jgi:hypothetical protein